MVTQARSRKRCLAVTVALILWLASTGQAQTPQSLSAASYVERSNDWYKKGELDRALADLDIALTFDPRCAPAYQLRGLIKQSRGDSDGALEEFGRAIEFQPRLAEAYCNRAQVHLVKRNFGAALADIDKAIEIKPRFAEAYNQRGEGYYSMGESDAAWRDFDKAIALNAHLAEAYNNRGALMYQKGNANAGSGWISTRLSRLSQPWLKPIAIAVMPESIKGTLLERSRTWTGRSRSTHAWRLLTTAEPTPGEPRETKIKRLLIIARPSSWNLDILWLTSIVAPST